MDPLAAADKASLVSAYGPEALDLPNHTEYSRSCAATDIFKHQTAVEAELSTGTTDHTWDQLWGAVVRRALTAISGKELTPEQQKHLDTQLPQTVRRLHSINIGACLYDDTANALERFAREIGAEHYRLWTQGSETNQLAKLVCADTFRHLGRTPREDDIIGGDKYQALLTVTPPPAERVALFIDDAPALIAKLHTMDLSWPWTAVRVRSGHQRERAATEEIGGTHKFAEQIRAHFHLQDPTSLGTVLQAIVNEKWPVTVFGDCDGSKWCNATMRVEQANVLVPLIADTLDADKTSQ